MAPRLSDHKLTKHLAIQTGEMTVLLEYFA